MTEAPLGGDDRVPVMPVALRADVDDVAAVLDVARRCATDYLLAVDERPVTRRAVAGADSDLPFDGVGAGAALAAFLHEWGAGLAASGSGRYLGFVTGGATPAAIAGDWLASAIDQNVVSSLDTVAGDIERQTLGWLADLLGLGPQQQGAFVPGATAANLVGLALARQWAGHRSGASVAEDGTGVLDGFAVIGGAAHSSIGKALSVLGLGRNALQTVDLLDGREAMDVAALERLLDVRGDRPSAMVVTLGSVNTADFDDLPAVLALRDRFPLWVHVDAAFGAFAALSESHASLVSGLGLADSVCVDLHKWLNVPYDSAVQFTRHRELQTAVFGNDAAYLAGPGAEVQFVDLTADNSRRFRALPAWLSLRAYGRDGHRWIVENSLARAQQFADLLAVDDRIRLLAPVRLNVVCFTLADDPTPQRVDGVLAAVRASGEAFLTGTVVNGVPAIRAAFATWRTTSRDVERTVAAVLAAVASG